MRKRFVPLLMSLVLCVSLFPSALAVEAVFSDVPDGSWFERELAVCAEAGALVGMGDGRFAPEETLTRAQLLTLAFRLYDLTRGKEPTVEAAPEDWDWMTLTLADGTVFEGYGDDGGVFSWWSWPKNGYKGVYVDVPGWSYGDSQGQRDWMDAHPDDCGIGAPATLTLNGVTYQGTTDCWIPLGGYVIMFRPESDEAYDVIRHALFRKTDPDRWWRDICYTVVQRGLEDIFDLADFSDASASRDFVAKVLADVCGDSLEKRFTVESIPDLPRGEGPDAYRDAVYALYEAGILTGTDEYGTFNARETLTRAQAAVIAARILDESLRMDAPSSGGQ